MRVIGPFRLLRALGRCEAGDVWSGYAADGTSVTVALVDTKRAGDTMWLRRWQAGAEELVRDGVLSVLAADLSPPTPWVACAWDDGIGAGRLFTAQGLNYVPAGMANPSQVPAAKQSWWSRGKDQSKAPAAAPQSPPVPQPPPPAQRPIVAPPAVPAAPAASLVAPPAAPPIPPMAPPIPPAAPVMPAPAPAPAMPAAAAPAAPAPPAVPVAPAGPGPMAVPGPPAVPVPPAVPMPPAGPPYPPAAVVVPPVGPSVMGQPATESVSARVPVVPPVVARARVAPDSSTQEVPVVGRPDPPPTVARGQVSLPAPPVLEPPTVPNQATVAGGEQLPTHLRPRGRGRAIADPTFAAPTGQLPAVAPPGKKRGRTPGRRRRRGRGRAVLLTIVLLLLVGAAGGVMVARLHLLDRVTAPQIEVPNSAALRGPGIEPPAAGDWPSSWAKFGSNDKTRTLSSLSGVGFPFRVLDTWNCSDRPEASGAAHYVCGPSGSADQAGGDVIVRICPAPCNSDQQVEMRQKEDAWGRQWTRAGGYVTWAETRAFPGTPRYGLVVVGYWRSQAEGAIDRQVVIRMTAPADKAADLQKVANDIYDAVT